MSSQSFVNLSLFSTPIDIHEDIATQLDAPEIIVQSLDALDVVDEHTPPVAPLLQPSNPRSLPLDVECANRIEQKMADLLMCFRGMDSKDFVGYHITANLLEAQDWYQLITIRALSLLFELNNWSPSVRDEFRRRKSLYGGVEMPSQAFLVQLIMFAEFMTANMTQQLALIFPNLHDQFMLRFRIASRIIPQLRNENKIPHFIYQHERYDEYLNKMRTWKSKIERVIIFYLSFYYNF